MTRIIGIGVDLEQRTLSRGRAAVPLAALCFWLLIADLTASAQLSISTERFTAQFDRGALVELRNAQDTVLVERKNDVSAGIHLLSGDHWVDKCEVTQPWDAIAGAAEKFTSLAGIEGASGSCKYSLDEMNGLVIEQQFDSPQNGLWGIELPVAAIPLDMNVIVPARSGLKFTASTPGASQVFNYPIEWEAQMLIVEGKSGGFLLWAEDAEGIYKRLTLDRGPEGWRLGFITMPFAPFEDKSACTSVRWHLNVYQGDWRVPAKQYRDWAETAFKPVRVQDQSPAWVKDIRCCVIMRAHRDLLEPLPKLLDPAQTLLYLYDWRAAGYDRNYPDYKEVTEAFAPFLARAHELGFRVMLHVNYFGCDPKHPVYKHMEMFQCRSPWGVHEREWWTWDRAVPPIKFAYINPASKKWRDFYVARIKELCTAYPVDALHLDQTLCIYNDYQGLVDGMSMMQGNVALHEALRNALPQVALSGEGLNEVTYRFEAFAQRHVWGINHSDGTFNEGQLTAAHPISSYLMRPFVTIYGYLGMAPPADGRMYAAWCEAYRYYGVIPTLKASLDDLNAPGGFMRQFLDEARFWQEHKVDIDVDGKWPHEVAFPFVTERGTPVTHLVERALTSRSRVISRTLKGVAWADIPGSIPEWRGYREDRLLGLDPGHWYPVFPETRDLDLLRVTSLANGHTIETVHELGELAFLRFRLASNATITLAPLLGGAACGSLTGVDQRFEVLGPLQAPDGAQFYARDDDLHAHPPYKSAAGSAYARFTLVVPKNAMRVVADVALDPEAVGDAKSDGVTFLITVQRKENIQRRGTSQDSSEPKYLGVGLVPFRGKEVSIELSVNPGKNADPSYDWARWINPRIECDWSALTDLSLTNTNAWRLALSGERVISLPRANDASLGVSLPGSIYLLPGIPKSISLPSALWQLHHVVSFISDSGRILKSPAFAAVEPGENTVGKRTHAGFLAHPPERGRTQIDFPITLPTEAAKLHLLAGIRDGSTSKDVIFAVQANGSDLFREKIAPGAWQDITCDLKPYAGKPIVLTLITDADGSPADDWACWGVPVIHAATAKP